MKPTYHLLQVTISAEETVAVLPLTKMADRALNELLREDFTLLAESATSPLVVDLRAVEYCSGSFITRLIELHKALTARAHAYTMLVSIDLRQTLAIIRVDGLLPIVDGPGIISCEQARRTQNAAKLKPQPNAPVPRSFDLFFQRWFAWLRPNIKH